MSAVTMARSVASVAEYTQEFLWRRRSNWLPIFFLYATFYMCRYNMNVAKTYMGIEFGWDKAAIGSMVSVWAIAYAAGQFINGQIADRFGGRVMFAIGALMTAAANMAIGIFASSGSMLLFSVFLGISGYFQAMGAPSFVKINSTWFGLQERGVFTGIFGICTQIGSGVALSLSGLLVATVHWRWAFIVPAIITLFYMVIMYVAVRDTPEELGFPSVDSGEDDDDDDGPVGFSYTLKKVFTSKPILLIATGYLCLGIVRYGLFIWYPDYLKEVHGIAPDSFTFLVTSWGLPLAGMAGALAAGFASDKLFTARRAPVVVIMYLGQAAMFVLFYFIAGPVISGFFLVFASFFVNGPHSLLGGAASMDFGGRKAAASAAGIIDAFQYVGMFFITAVGGRILRAFGWNGWVITLIVCAIIGASLLAILWNVRPGGGPKKGQGEGDTDTATPELNAAPAGAAAASGAK